MPISVPLALGSIKGGISLRYQCLQVRTVRTVRPGWMYTVYNVYCIYLKGFFTWLNDMAILLPQWLWWYSLLRNTNILKTKTDQCSRSWRWWLQVPSGCGRSQSESGKNENPKMLRLQPDSNSPSHDERLKRTSYRPPPFIPEWGGWVVQWLQSFLEILISIQVRVRFLPELKATQKGSATKTDDFDRTTYIFLRTISGPSL